MRLDRAVRLIDLIPLALAVWIAGAIVSTWVGRFGHPYDLEWMEGGMLAHAWRLAHGLPIYPEAGPEFVPYVYPPGFSALLSIVERFGALSYPWGRGLSVLGQLGACSALAFGVARHGGSRVLGIVAVGGYLACYEASGAFYDLVRPDSLALGLTAWALVLGLEDRKGADVAAGLLLAAGFLVKHNVAAFGLPMALGFFVRDGWRGALRFGLASAGPALLATGVLQWRTDGRLLQYIVEVPGTHPAVFERGWPGAIAELGKVQAAAVAITGFWVGVLPVLRGSHAAWLLLPIAAAAGGAWYGVEMPPARGVGHPSTEQAVALFGGLAAALAGSAVWLGHGLKARALPWRGVYGAGLVLMALFLAALMRAHHGGFLNVLMPAHWALMLAFGVALGRLRTELGDAPAVLFTALAASLQLGLQVSELTLERLVPGPLDVAAGDSVVEALSECSEPVFSPLAPWMAVQAGFEPGPHLIAIWDIGHKRGPFYRQQREGFGGAARTHRWSCVVDGGRNDLGFGIPAHYRAETTLRHPGKALVPRTGWRVRPTVIMVPTEEPPE